MKFFFIIVILAISIFSSCVSVRQEDLNAWRNVPVIDLETNPVFNAMKLEKKTLSDGSTLWSYTAHGGTFQNCSANSQTNTQSSSNQYDQYGYDKYGYDRYGYNRQGYNRQGYNRQGYNRQGQKITSTSESSAANSRCITGEYICVNQFLVKDGIVLWYRPVGNNCYTNCAFRPDSNPCGGR